jgi:hypothetical protein
MKQDPGFSIVLGSVPNGQNLLKEEREVFQDLLRTYCGAYSEKLRNVQCY